MGRGRSAGWALLGASTIASEFMAPAIRATQGHILHLVSNDARRAAAFASEHDIPNHGTCLADALADPAVDAVYISSINSRHCAQAIASAEAGKHVFCDKPLATTVADARRMVEACRAAGVVLGVNHHLRSTAVHQRMKAMIAEGLIGKPRSLVIDHVGFLRPELQSWRIKDPAEGAIYLDLGIHDIDLASYLLDRRPVSVSAVGSSVELGVAGAHDHAMFTMRMEGDVLAQVHDSFVIPGAEGRIAVYGTEGILVATASFAQNAPGRLILRAGGKETAVEVERNDNYVDTLNHFLAATRGDSRPLATGEDGLDSLRVAEAVMRSALSARTEAVDWR
jgi:1,5-anhydro-D-fructose reductase (1,5-anhydro-D-mannitol-forming)